MNRLFAIALATPLLCAVPARAQNPAEAGAPAQPSGAEAGSSEKPAAAQPPAGGSPEADPRVQEAVRQAVAKAKEELREEVRAEIQGAQSAATFMGVEEKPKLEFLELDGYLRFRANLFDNVDLRRDADPSGYYLFPRAIIGTTQHGTLTDANMRFRLEPTLNVSEQVRIRSQLDLLDNLVLGSTPERSQWSSSTFGASSQVPPVEGVNSDRSSIVVKRAWAEVQTPLGLLSFGRMPNQWGLGILANAGGGLDDDFGDNVDRIQFAIPIGSTPFGALTLIPMWDFVFSGVTTQFLGNAGIGQPFDRDQADDARGIGVRLVKLDGPDDLKRKLEKGLSSFNFGAWYSYKSQSYDFPTYTGVGGATADPSSSSNPGIPAPVRRGAWAHVLDLWWRYETKHLRLESEGVGAYGEIGNASDDPARGLGPVLLRQFGAVLQGNFKFGEGRIQLGAESGFASGDGDPGFGNLPGRVGLGTGGAPLPGDIDGRQYAAGDKILDIRNFRFNRAYRVDNILWREILGSVTDAWYLKPTFRWELLEGLVGTAQVIYSQAIYSQSTPSRIHSPLGVEADIALSYTSDDGFVASLSYGILFPLEGLGYGTSPQSVTGTELTRGHALRAGLAVKF